MDLGIITIGMEHYLQLLKDSEFLSRLEAAGVDNWEGYSEAFGDDDDDWDDEDED